ncbi:receptor-like protein kinase ANXUR2 [Cynara cardunculus var. scolymus]|uniref:receptor-like protein kinase ANXUR2 n=1 Tax=Cynara cardunculus var. scolymus TaxID=59895 RepID=UPI000D631186|nr:receptor-like protein kinase ANXUR2 [Cynara cardunculus var. scolymus]
MEIFMLASYKHDNLVTLIGFTDEGGEKIIVYKHEARGSLDKYLANKDLTWSQRLQICLGAARGLVYLHSGAGLGHRVLHRDIKSSNILLDVNWEAKISDFGLSKIGPTNQAHTFLVTKACGTIGYVDPQYVKTGTLSKESDVYSFGVVLFEVLCGRFAFVGEYEDERRFLVGLVKHHEGSKTLDKIILPNLQEQMKPDSLDAFLRIALQCLNEQKKYRPTMRSIVQELEIALQLQTNITSTRLWGSFAGGEPWSIRLESHQKLRKIFIDHQSFIYSIAFATQDINNDLVHYFQQHGGAIGPSGYTISQINFDDDEEIIGIQGTFGVVPTVPFGNIPLISSLCFLTNKKTHGPFGMEEGTRFSESWNVGSLRGFYGRAGSYLDSFGCLLKAMP